MKFFFDNNLSENLAQGLKTFGEDVIHLKDMFNEDTEDRIWLKQIGNKKMFLITRDERIRRNPFELNALKTYKVGLSFWEERILGGVKSFNRWLETGPE